MAVNSQGTNPIIVEPPASPNSRPPSSLHIPSLTTSSSSTSFDSSRPQSRASSATSPSGSPSPAPTDGRYDMEPVAASDIEPQPPNISLIPNEQARNTTTPSTTHPPQRPEGSLLSNGDAWTPPYFPFLFNRRWLEHSLFNRRWLEHSLGVFGLVASLVGLLFIGVRTYKLSVITTENSTLDGCLGLIQAGVTTVENSTQLCKIIMKTGPLRSPYHLSKRTLRSSLALVSKWMKDPSKQKCGFPYIGCQPEWAPFASAPAIIISATLASGGLLLIFALRNARSTDIFTSPAYSDIHITQEKDNGPETLTGQGILEKHDSEDHDHDLGEIHQQARASYDQDSLMKDTAPLQSVESSSTTLVDSCSEPKVSLEDSSSGEKHEDLVELQVNGHTKAFYKIGTSEIFHLKHWKDKHTDFSHTFHHRRPSP